MSVRARICYMAPHFALARVRSDKYLLHESECNFVLSEALVGDLVEFDEDPSPPSGRPRGLRVNWVERSVDPESVDATITGTVVNIVFQRGFAFMQPDNGGADVLCHVAAFADYDGSESRTFATMSRGDRLTCRIRVSTRGPRGEDIKFAA